MTYVCWCILRGECIFQAIRVFLLMRDLCLALLGQSEKRLPLSKIENSVNLEDVLDLSKWKFDVFFVSSIVGFLVFLLYLLHQANFHKATKDQLITCTCTILRSSRCVIQFSRLGVLTHSPLLSPPPEWRIRKGGGGVGDDFSLCLHWGKKGCLFNNDLGENFFSPVCSRFLF